MIVLRFLAVLSLLAIAISFGLFVYTRNRGYLTLAWRTFQFVLVVVIVVMLLYVVERLVLI